MALQYEPYSYDNYTYKGMPKLPEMAPLVYPTYTPPARDVGRLEYLTQQAAAPGLRGLRSQVQRAMGQRYENPNLRRMTLREALAGYGRGLSEVMGGARREGLGQYEAEYAPQVQAAQMAYQTEVGRKQQEWQTQRQAQMTAWEAQRQAQMAEYEAALKEYMGRRTGAIKLPEVNPY